MWILDKKLLPMFPVGDLDVSSCLFILPFFFCMVVEIDLDPVGDIPYLNFLGRA